MEIRIGEIEYANCTPIFTALKKNFDCSGYRFVREVPSALNAMLSNGEVDISPSSSIEYGKSFEKYCLMPQISISSIGPVKSVFLFSRIPIENLHNKTIGLTTESDTSVNLLKIILKKKYGYENEFQRTPLPLKEALQSHEGLLLIGDAALKASLAKHNFHVYDLGQQWYEFTGLPFVFALWIVRRDAAASKHEAMAVLRDNLLKAKKLAYDSYASIALHSREREWMSASALVDYWKTISYDLTAEHLKGLETFYRHAAEMGLIPKQPEIALFSW
ncbi:menaquinone biosynthesis protein [Geotalea sp. SG265]|uniref:menaquinone biosynthetic enzyme MqnA/MqnD family protein n=1 Tax=Geotalea sp. SG265 TaxID=2922867 RepID=UPI001FB03326|nr:menaquinone biosynthesis protein [Geotalea sp. SG265]